MKKWILLAVLACTASMTSYAQSPIGKGGSQLNMGIGLHGGHIPLYLGYDYGVHPDITVGPQLNFDLGLEYLGISARGDYHFNSIMSIPQNWDFYAGLSLGAVVGLDLYDHDHHHHHGHHGLDLDAGLQIGGRYYWNSSWGINLEIGGGSHHSGGRLGLSYRF